MPSAVIAPSALVPPTMPFTAQVTRVSAALLTVALKFWMFPSKTVALAGVTLTVTGAGCGTGGGGLAEPPPQLTRKEPAAKKPAILHTNCPTEGSGRYCAVCSSCCGRGRMLWRIAGEIPTQIIGFPRSFFDELCPSQLST